MRERKKKSWIKQLTRVGFLLLLGVTIYFVTNVLRIKSEHGINQQEGLYWQREDSIEVAAMGTSHVHCGVNTGLLWEKYGIAAYDYSGAEQPLWMTWYYMRELYKYQTPKMILLDLYAPARFKEDYQYDWISENIYGMRFSLNKLRMLSVSVEPSRLHQYFPSFAVYHSRYDELEEEDFNHFFWDSQEKEAFKGFTPYWKRTPQHRPEISEEERDGLSAKSEKYLRKIIALAREKGTELVLIVVPYVETNQDRRTYNQIMDIAAREGVTFIDYNEYYDEMGIDFQEDFNDESHLNYWGSCKFTDFLGEFLASHDEIPDRRGQKGYESWEENARIIRREAVNHGEGLLNSSPQTHTSDISRRLPPGGIPAPSPLPPGLSSDTAEKSG